MSTGFPPRVLPAEERIAIGDAIGAGAGEALRTARGASPAR